VSTRPDNHTTIKKITGISIAADLERRREAGRHMPPLDCGHRDPLDCGVPVPGPSGFGLTRDELRAEWRRCAGDGWRAWELRARFAVAVAA
jgi:hypothetical protein